MVIILSHNKMGSLTIYRMLRRLAKKRNIIHMKTAPLPKEANDLWYLDEDFEVI